MYVARMRPVAYGDQIDVTIDRYCAGAFPRREEYIGMNFAFFPRGVEKASGHLWLDRPLRSYAASMIGPDGEIEDAAINLTGTRDTSKPGFEYRLEWQIPDPRGWVLIDLIMPRPKLGGTL